MSRAAPLARRGAFVHLAAHLARRALYHVLSFEALFALCFYSNELKLFFPPFRVDETVVLGALCLPLGLLIILREGIYVRGLTIVATVLLLFTWATLSWGWSPSRSLAFRTITYLFSFNLLCLVCGALVIAPSRERTARFLAFLLMFAMVIVVSGLEIYATFGNFRFFKGFAFGEVIRAYLSWGYVAAQGATIAFALAIFSRMLGPRQMVAMALFGLAVAFLLVGSGRGPLLALAVACLVALGAGLPQFRRGQVDIPRWQLVGLVVVVAGAVYIISLAMGGAAFGTFGRFLKLLEEARNPDVVEGPNRFVYYAKAIEFWLRAPLVGNGLASYSLLYQGFEQYGAHPHNIFLEMLSELGVVGLGLLLLALWSGLRLVERERLRHDGLLLCILMLFAGQLFAAMISADISGQQALFLFLGLLALRPPAPGAQPARSAPARTVARAAPSRR